MHSEHMQPADLGVSQLSYDAFKVSIAVCLGDWLKHFVHTENRCRGISVQRGDPSVPYLPIV